jgi:hypothetical protein
MQVAGHTSPRLRCNKGILHATAPENSNPLTSANKAADQPHRSVHTFAQCMASNRLSLEALIASYPLQPAAIRSSQPASIRLSESSFTCSHATPGPRRSARNYLQNAQQTRNSIKGCTDGSGVTVGRHAREYIAFLRLLRLSRAACNHSGECARIPDDFGRTHIPDQRPPVGQHLSTRRPHRGRRQHLETNRMH